ncbi:MAG: hypothetical protein JW884_08710 [Deltaproteobacteria bacterium]|nr:hypothetical protein [Deltaproteobacteria bacterium]
MDHLDAGTTTGRILYCTKVSSKRVEVRDGSTVEDWMEQEQKSGRTSATAAIVCSWADRLVNLIDATGHSEVSIETA